MQETPYTEEYYSHLDRSSRNSAAAIVPAICKLLAPGSVIDVGCGRGFWAAAFAECGVEDIYGIDGEWVDASRLAIPADRFRHVNLEQPIRLDRQFDLALTLEVAEHLPPASAETFVKSLCALAPAVVFSAAIPGQGGDRHINERWQSYWAGLFHQRGYVAIDFMRRGAWMARNVAYWYAQNTLLYVRKDRLDSYPPMLRTLAKCGAGPLSVAHPRLYESYRQRLARVTSALADARRQIATLERQLAQGTDKPDAR